MKKNILILLFSLLVTISFAQEDSVSKALDITKLMTDALSLDEEQKMKVYKIQLNRFQEVASVRNEYNDDTQTRKEELRKAFNRLHGKLTNALGKEKMQQWAEYKQYN